MYLNCGRSKDCLRLPEWVVCQWFQDSEDDEAGAGPERKVKHKADKRKLEDAIERENAKKARSKEEAEKKVVPPLPKLHQPVLTWWL